MSVAHSPSSWMRHVVYDFGSKSYMRHGGTDFSSFYHLKTHTAFTV